jgi:hypothetical protein
LDGLLLSRVLTVAAKAAILYAAEQQHRGKEEKAIAVAH